MKKTVMVTGASGFVGSNFIKKYKDEFNIIPVCLIKKTPEELNYEGVDCILHLAALVHQMKGVPEEKYFEINTELTRRVAEQAKKAGVKHFVFYSTVAVYGTHGCIEKKMILSSVSPTNPKTPYAESKLKAEKILENLSDKGFAISIIRPPMVYGEGCPGNMKKLCKLVKYFPVLPFGNNKNKRSLIEINNLIEITMEIIKNKTEGLTLALDNKNLSIKQIVEMIALKQGKRRMLLKMPLFLILFLSKIFPTTIKSLYGDLRFSEEER